MVGRTSARGQGKFDHDSRGDLHGGSFCDLRHRARFHLSHARRGKLRYQLCGRSGQRVGGQGGVALSDSGPAVQFVRKVASRAASQRGPIMGRAQQLGCVTSDDVHDYEQPFYGTGVAPGHALREEVCDSVDRGARVASSQCEGGCLLGRNAASRRTP